jgi:hypothetical protein
MDYLWAVTNFWAGHFIFPFGILLLALAFIIAARGGMNNPQSSVAGVICATGAACVAVELPGLAKLDLPGWGTFTGAIAILVIVLYWWRWWQQPGAVAQGHDAGTHPG